MLIREIRATVVREMVLWGQSYRETTTIAPPGARVMASPAGSAPHPQSLLVEIVGDDGLVGIGLGGGGRAAQVVVEQYLAPLLNGQKACDIQALWELMFRTTLRYGQAGIVVMAMSGIDLALWDLVGKAQDKSIWQLLGEPVRDTIPVYATVRDPAWVGEEGYWGLKLGGPCGPLDGKQGIEANTKAVARARQALGSEPKLMIDCSSIWTVDYCLEMARLLDPFDIYLIEEPVPPWDIEGYAQLRREIDSVRIAGGEHAYTRYGARQLLCAEALDVIQPDVRWTGGLSEMLIIYEEAHARGIECWPHRGGMAWALPMIMAREGCPVAEGLNLALSEESASLYAGEPLPSGGCLAVGDGPGFGLTLRSDRLGEYRLST